MSAASPGLGSAYDDIRASQVQPNPGFRQPRVGIEKKPHGNCLCRISSQSVLLHDWKPCLWVVEEGGVLHVFRDGDAYTAYHYNPYLDNETRSFLLKASIPLTSDHMCRSMKKKKFLGETVHGFTLERPSELGLGNTVA